jgi:hypothetical protein
MLTDRIGRERFAALPNVSPLPNGGLQLDLVAEPWAADYEELLAAHRRIYPVLFDSGMFTTNVNKCAAAWTPPNWKMKADQA